MNKSNLVLTLGAALMLAPMTSLFAQSIWQTVDDLTPAAGRDIVSDGAGGFISLALDHTTASALTAVSRSTDGGTSWQTVGSIAGYALDLAVDPDGVLFACGNRSTDVSGRAFVWQSLDHGVTWTVSNPWAGQPMTLLCSDAAAGNAGTVYLCGFVSGGNRWVIRKGQCVSTSIVWSTIDNFPAAGLSQPNSIFVRTALAGQPDEVLVCGKANNLWTVRRSANGGSTWTTLDAYNFAGLENSAFAATIGLDGAIHVVGRVSRRVGKTTEYGWLVRRSANGGANWTNTDYVANGWPQYSITADAFGRVFAVGFDSAKPYTWLVRGSVDGGTTWTTTDVFLPSGATQSQALGVASDAMGNVCVIGELTAGMSKTAVIRRLAAP